MRKRQPKPPAPRELKPCAEGCEGLAVRITYQCATCNRTWQRIVPSEAYLRSVSKKGNRQR